MGLRGLSERTGGLGVDACQDHMCTLGHGVGSSGWFGFILFYVEPVGDVCLATGRALG